MPTVVHAIFGGVVALLFHLVSKGGRRVFTERAVIVFAFNAFIGPDIFKIPRVFIDPGNATLLALDQALHSIVGWVAWAFLVAVPFWLLARVKASQADTLPYTSTAILVLGAGLTHLGLDVLDLSQEGYGSLSVLPWDPSTSFNLATFHTGSTWDGLVQGLPSRAGAAILFATGLCFLCLISYFLLRKRTRHAIIAAGIFVGTVTGLVVMFGSGIVYGEHDLGYLVYLSVFFFVPLALMYWSLQGKDAAAPSATRAPVNEPVAGQGIKLSGPEGST